MLKNFFWKDIIAHLIKIYGILLDIIIISRILKEKLILCDKNLLPRPLLIDKKILKLKKYFYTVFDFV